MFISNTMHRGKKRKKKENIPKVRTKHSGQDETLGQEQVKVAKMMWFLKGGGARGDASGVQR